MGKIRGPFLGLWTIVSGFLTSALTFSDVSKQMNTCRYQNKAKSMLCFGTMISGTTVRVKKKMYICLSVFKCWTKKVILTTSCWPLEETVD